MRGTKWEQWLKELSELAADAPEWEALEEFQQAIVQLAAAKRDERSSESERLAAVLAALQLECAGDLHYFKLDCVEWSVDASPVAVSQDVSVRLEQLRDDLKLHASLRHRSPSSHEEAHLHWQELTALSQRIIETHAALAVSLIGAPSQVATEPKAEAQEPPPFAPAEEETLDLAARSDDPTLESVDMANSLPLSPPEPESRQEARASGVAGKSPAQQQDQTPASEQIESTPESTIDDELLWQFLLNDDVPGAYWVARSMRATGRQAPAPDWLLAAMEGAYQLRDETDLLVADLLEITRQHQPEAEKSHEMMFGLAASLRAALIAPRSGLISWVKD